MCEAKPWSRLMAELFALFSRTPRSTLQVIREARLGPDDRVLDIGCGPGAAVREAAKVAAAAVGADPSAPMIDIARRRTKNHGTEFVVAPAEDLPFDADSFTVVWSVRAFHHWDDRRAGLAEARRVLSPAGRLLILENKAKRHGLTEGRAAEVAELLRLLGYGAVDVRPVGRNILIEATTT